jgi:hypothetical protein
MSSSELISASCCQGLRETMLDYLRTVDAQFWPGGDELTLDVALASYAQAAMAGVVPDEMELRRRHPEWIAELEVLFAGPKPNGRVSPNDAAALPCDTIPRAD